MHLKKRLRFGVKGLAPLGCLPLWGREGVTLAIALSVLREGFLQSPMETTNAIQDFLVTGCLFPFVTPYGKGKKKDMYIWFNQVL